MCAADPAAFDPNAERSQRHARILQRLAEIGMNLAEAVDLQRQGSDADAADLAMKFARIAKAVRQTLVLEARLADDEQVRRDAAAARERERQDALRHAAFAEARAEGRRRKNSARWRIEEALYAEDSDFDGTDFIEEMDDWCADDSDLERFARLSLEEAILDLGRRLGWPNALDDEPAPPSEAAAGLAAFLLTDRPCNSPPAAPAAITETTPPP